MHLAALEAVVEAVRRSLHVQRAIVDDRAIGSMRKLRRVLRAQGDVELERRWKFLFDYLGKVSGGGGAHRARRGGPAAAERKP